MKKFALLLCWAVVLSVALFPCAGGAQSDSSVLRIGVYDNPPKIFKENGEIKGFWADILDHIAEEEGWQVEYVHGTWSEGLERLEKGDIDIMVDVAVSEDREEIFDFHSEDVLLNWAEIYTRPGVEVNSIFDLEGLDIAVMKSGIHYTGPLGIRSLLDDFGISANFRDVDVYADVFEELRSGDADAGVVNRIFGIANAEKYGVERTGVVFNPIELKFAMTKGAPGNEAIAAAVDRHIREMKDDPESVYHESLERHLRGIAEEVEVFPEWAGWLLIAGGVLILFAAVLIIAMRSYQASLKKRVREQTARLKESEERYRLITETSIDGILQVDRNGEVSLANRTAEKIWSLEKGGLLGKPFASLLDKADVPRARAGFEKVIQGSSAKEEYHISPEGKGGLTILVGAYPFRAKGRIAGATMVVRDITKRKGAEKALKEKVGQLEKTMQVMTGREKKMAELKEELRDLRKKCDV